MKILMLEDFVEQITKSLAGKRKSVTLYGRAYPEEGLCQVLSLKSHPDFAKVGQGRKEEDSIFFHIGKERVSLGEIEVIPYQSEYQSRAEGIIDTAQLSQKLVALVGLGSVGSALAIYLAQAAVGRFRLVDKDFMTAANVSRHVGDIFHLGRSKTRAVKDLILARNPLAQVDAFTEDFLLLPSATQTKRLGGADLVIASTDSNACQFMVNELCLSLRLPSLYVGCYERAQAGEIVYVVPGVTPCFNCLVEFRSQNLADFKIKDRRLPYMDEPDNGFQAEPGLAIDIGYVTTVAAVFALALLAPQSTRGALLDPARNLLLLHAGSQPEDPYADLFTMPFDYLRARVKRDGRCEICQRFYQQGMGNGRESDQSGGFAG